MCITYFQFARACVCRDITIRKGKGSTGERSTCIAHAQNCIVYLVGGSGVAKGEQLREAISCFKLGGSIANGSQTRYFAILGW